MFVNLWQMVKSKLLEIQSNNCLRPTLLFSTFEKIYQTTTIHSLLVLHQIHTYIYIDCSIINNTYYYHLKELIHYCVHTTHHQLLLLLSPNYSIHILKSTKNVNQRRRTQ
jgi:hypothetical protein